MGPVQHIGGLTGYADAAISNVSFSGSGSAFRRLTLSTYLSIILELLELPASRRACFSRKDLHPGATPSIGMAFANDGFELGLGAILCGRDGCIVPSDVNFQGFGRNGLGVRRDRPRPQPSTWAMLVLGFGGLGCAGYRQARKVRVVSEAR